MDPTEVVNLFLKGNLAKTAFYTITQCIQINTINTIYRLGCAKNREGYRNGN